MVGDTHQIEVTFDPVETEDTLVFSNYDNNLISVTDEGLITALSAGNTTLTVALLSNSLVTKDINITIINDEITSTPLDIIDNNSYKIITGEEPNTTIDSILEKVDNYEYIEVYTIDDELINPQVYEQTLIKTGMKMKLVINDVEKDEVVVVIKGDIDGDGIVNVTDLAPLEWHILEDDRDYIEGIYLDAADLDGDRIVDVRDEGKLMKFILEDPEVPTLND